MARRKAKKPAPAAKPARKRAATRRASAKRPSTRKAARRAKASVRKAAPKASATKRRPAPARKQPRKSAAGSRSVGKVPGKTPKLDRARRTLEDIAPGPPSSLDLDRDASAARSGRAELAEKQREHRNMNDFGGGDPDVDVEDAYFTGEEAPGGDNPTPDQDIVDDIGKALGLEYEDNEELKSSDKVVERDKHRWELDPASSEDYKDRK
jgi:Family of unknown function (DUF6335)